MWQLVLTKFINPKINSKIKKILQTLLVVMQLNKIPLTIEACTTLSRLSLLYHCHTTSRSLVKTLSNNESDRLYVTCVTGGCSFSWFALGISPTRFKWSMSCIRSRLGTVYKPSLVISLLLAFWNEKYWYLKNIVKHHKVKQLRHYGHWRRYGVFIVSFEHISHLFIVFLILTLNK